MLANGNSLGNGSSMDTRDIREPWYVRLWRPLQDRGPV
jgi:hypothetical protein